MQTARPSIRLSIFAVLLPAAFGLAFMHRMPSGAASPHAETSAAPAPPAAGPPQPDYMADPSAAMKHIRLLARQTHGDWDRLSPNDQQLLDAMTGGHGHQMLRMIAQGRTQPKNKPAAGLPSSGRSALPSAGPLPAGGPGLSAISQKGDENAPK